MNKLVTTISQGVPVQPIFKCASSQVNKHKTCDPANLFTYPSSSYSLLLAAGSFAT